MVLFAQPFTEADAAALFSRECRPSPAQLGALRVMLWVTTAYFFLPFLCLSVLYGLIGRELWRSRGQLRGPATSGREKGHRQTVRVLSKWRRLCSKHPNRAVPLPRISQPSAPLLPASVSCSFPGAATASPHQLGVCGVWCFRR